MAIQSRLAELKRFQSFQQQTEETLYKRTELRTLFPFHTVDCLATHHFFVKLLCIITIVALKKGNTGTGICYTKFVKGTIRVAVLEKRSNDSRALDKSVVWLFWV